MNLFGQTLSCQYDTPFSPFRAKDFEKGMAALADSGFTAVEIAIAEPEKVDVSYLRNLAVKHGLTITTLATGQAYALQGLSLSSLEEETAMMAVDYIRRHIDLAASLGGCPVTIGTIRGKCEESQTVRAMEMLRKTVWMCVQYAASKGVVIQMEPLNREETNLLNSVRETVDFWHSLNCPDNMGILFDIYHSAREGEDMRETLLLAGRRISNVHLSDFPGRGLPFSGKTDFKQLYALLKEIGYSGAITLETLSVPDSTYIISHGFECIKQMIDRGDG